MTAKGAFTFVLHSHLPYVRLAGRWPHGEEWIHEAASETYIPLLQALYDLKEDGVPFRLTMSITPILAEQLADPTIHDNLNDYLDTKIDAAKRDVAHFAPHSDDDTPSQGHPDPHLHYLAGYYRDWYEGVKTAYNERFKRDIVGALRDLQDAGYIEILASAATHAYLPLLDRDSSLDAQIRIGVQMYRTLFGRDPQGFWLPECAYRPAYTTDDGRTRPGIESFLAKYGLRYFFSETHAITGGSPVGVAAGDVIGPYGTIQRRYVIPPAQHTRPKDTTTYEPYEVVETVTGTGASKSSGVAVIGRNNTTGQQVWSADWGYPGDFDYREFHRKSGTSGLPYWRVTGARVDLGHKDYYHPDWASYKIDQHAEHFAHLVGDLTRDYHTRTERYGLIASNYDAELFGHWWFEGVAWLSKVLRHLTDSPDVDLVTTGAYLEAYPPKQTLTLPESSWGAGGQHFNWENGETRWMWPPLHAAEQRLETLANQHTQPDDDTRAVLNQAARELLLAQASDWPFHVTTGNAREYAIQRFSQHLERFEQLAASIENGTPDRAMADRLYVQDHVFADMDYRWFSTQASPDNKST